MVTVGDLYDQFYRIADLSNTLTETLRANTFHAVAALQWECDTEGALTYLLPSITNFFYEEGQDPKETKKYPGAIGTNLETLVLANQLNALKGKFAGDAARYAEQSKTSAEQNRLPLDLIDHANTDDPFINTRPFHLGTLHHLCIRQTSRKIPIAHDETGNVITPNLISWSWDRKHRSIKRKTAADAAEDIQRRGLTSETAALDKEALKGQPSTEIAIIQDRSSSDSKSLYVTVSYIKEKRAHGEGPSDIERVKRLASMPLLYLYSPDEQPRFKFLNRDPYQDAKRTRADLTFDGDADFRSIRGYRAPKEKRGMREPSSPKL